MINEFLQYLQYEKNYSSHTVLSYHTDLIQFCNFLQVEEDQFTPASVEEKQIQQWALALMSSDISVTHTVTKDIYTQVILAVFTHTWLHTEKSYVKNHFTQNK